MYLARQFESNQIFFSLRETISFGKILTHRNLVDLGKNPGKFIRYSGQGGFYLADSIFRKLKEKDVKVDNNELENIFFDFLDPDTKKRLAPFLKRSESRNWKKMDQVTQKEILQKTHIFDRRRLFFLRCGPISQQRMHRSLSMFRVLLGKSRDEIEQLCMARESGLSDDEYKNYVYAIFDLQRFFGVFYAITMPQALDRDKMDKRFIEEVCDLDSDKKFWAGFQRDERIPFYLRRYLIMYFDYQFQEIDPWSEYVNEFIKRHRWHNPPKVEKRMSQKEAITIFGVSKAELEGMNERELTRLYRRKAHKLHPDKGGDHDKFIELTTAYNRLLRNCK